MKPGHVVEAALFSAGRPLSIEEICAETGLARPAVRQAVDELAAAYKERDTALEVSKAGAKWAMQVRTTAAEQAARFAPMEIPKKVLKTLALIAYHQPLKQSELVEMIGSKTYEHVGELRERGLVTGRREGLTRILVTTERFPEYFGIDADNPDAVRGAMAALVGLPPPKKREETALEGFQEGSAEAMTAEGAEGEPADLPAESETPASDATAEEVAEDPVTVESP